MSGVRASALAFWTAAATLFAQVLLHRVVSAKLLNNYAFLVISLTMLGFAVSGVVLTRWQDRFLESAREAIPVCAALFALTLLLATAVLYHEAVNLFPTTRSAFVLTQLAFLPQGLLVALPFACCGLILGALLAAPGLPTRRIYGADLVGSAFGAVAVIPAIGRLGVERSLVLAGSVLLVASLAVTRPRRLASRLLVGAAAVALAAGLVFPDRVFAMRYPRGTTLWGIAAAGPPYGVEYVAWDPVARIEVSRIWPPNPNETPFPSLIGDDDAFHARFRKMLTQNNFAFTYAVDYDGHPESLKGIERTVYASAYETAMVPKPRVLVIGVGGGFDILTALAEGAESVTGIEVNAATVAILKTSYREYFHHWIDDPRVRIVQGEGRQYLATHPDRYDVLQLSGVDSYSGTPAAAHVFSESYLYTQEAFDLYLSRLSDRGVLSVMRLEHTPPREMLRVLTTAVEALRRSGVQHPAEHIVMVADTRGHFVALLMKRAPFTAEEVQRAEAWTSTNPFLYVAAAPNVNAKDANPYQTFLGFDQAYLERMYIASLPFDVVPLGDDRPFFFRFSFWWHLFTGNPKLQATIPAMELSVIVLVLALAAAAALCIYAPLRILAARGRHVPGTWKHVAFFGGTGLGYLAIEVALLQKFGLVLGHPNYALSVVLASLLLTTGLGALFSAVLVKGLGHLRTVSLALALLLLAERFIVFPRLMGLIGLSLPLRALLVFAMIAPIGIALGVFFPAGLEVLKRDSPEFVPWAWGINGIFSVLAPVLGVAFSMTYGMNALLLLAVPIYVGVGLVAPGEAPAP